MLPVFGISIGKGQPHFLLLVFLKNRSLWGLPVTGEKAVIHSEIRYYTNVTVYLASDFTVVFGV